MSLEEGLSALRERRPDVLVLGLGLSGDWSTDGGAERLRTFMAAAPDAPIVVLNGEDNRQGTLASRRAGVAEQLQKSERTPALLGRTLRWIAERARLRGKLRQRDAWIRSITKSNAGGVLRVDPAGRIQYANQALASLLGFDREEELVGLDLKSLYANPEEWNRLLAGEGTEGAEVEFEHPDGSTFVGLLGAEPARGKDGRVLHYDGFLVDITDRKEREEELRREKERFEGLVQEVKEYAIFMLDPEGRIRSWNEGARRIKGYSKEEIIGEPLSTFYTEKDREAGVPEENLERARTEGTVVDKGWRVCADGSRFWAHVTITALHEDDGSLRGFAKVTRDMTDRNKRERRYEAIFNQTYQFIGLMEPDGTLIEANETALQFGGIDREEVVGKPFWEAYWWQIDEDTQRDLREAIDRAAQGEFVRYEVEVQGGDENVIIDFSIRPVVGEDGEVTLLIPEGRNITELKALKRRERKLERQNRRFDQFASLVSHDLRGPLNVAKGRLGLARGEDDPSHLAAAERALDRMNAIIEDLLTLTWGGQDIDPEKLRIHSLAEVAEASWNYVDTANVTLQLESDLDLRAEEGRLRRLLENLFRNAVEHGREAETVRIGAVDDGLYVEDDGPGIPAKKQEEVLEAGYSSVEEGTGLGLSIVKSIVETHGWTLAITESEEGGARFAISGTG